ncbi:MAG: SRPBCC family protein [Steroidobacteraceae bacterium]
MRLLILCVLLLPAAVAPVRADTSHPYTAAEAQQQVEFGVRVTLDSAGQRGLASATVRIHARREIVWSLIKSCAESVKLVPGLVECEVIETAPDRSSQIIRHVLDYSWYLPRLNYEIRATYEYPTRILIERISGDFSVLKGSWTLESDGAYTVARYEVELAPGFWVPQWLVRAALRRDLPKLMSALRARAEWVQRQEPAAQGSS